MAGTPKPRFFCESTAQDLANRLSISVSVVCRPKGDHVDVKTIGRDEDSGIG